MPELRVAVPHAWRNRRAALTLGPVGNKVLWSLAAVGA